MNTCYRCKYRHLANEFSRGFVCDCICHFNNQISTSSNTGENVACPHCHGIINLQDLKLTATGNAKHI